MVIGRSRTCAACGRRRRPRSPSSDAVPPHGRSGRTRGRRAPPRARACDGWRAAPDRGGRRRAPRGRCSRARPGGGSPGTCSRRRARRCRRRCVSRPSVGTGDAERADARGVDEERAGREPDELAVGGRVAAARVVVAHVARALAVVAEQRVDQRGLAHARRAEHDGRPARGQVVVREIGDAGAGQRRDDPHLDAGRDRLGGDAQALGIVGHVGLVEHDDGRRPAGPRDREVALEATQVEVAVEARDDERDVDVGGQDLLAGEVAGVPVGAGVAPEGGPAGQDGLDHDGVPTVEAGHGDPVADGRQVAGAHRLVAEAAGDDGIAVAGRRRDAPGVAMGRDDPGRQPARRVERQEGRGPARVPAEVGERVGDGVSRRLVHVSPPASACRCASRTVRLARRPRGRSGSGRCP